LDGAAGAAEEYRAVEEDRTVAVYAIEDRVPDIDPTAFIHPDAVVVGAVTIEAEASIWPGAVLRGDYGEISIGARTSIQDGSVVHATAAHPTRIGADCVVGHIAHLEGCTVEDGSLIGSGSVVLHEAVVRSGALVAAGAVVSGRTEVPSGAMALGVPARIRAGIVPAGSFGDTVALYVANGKRYAGHLRRLD
jgi:carbonic anhydrase/acetyltransferase-like protein (isoleucine patch superfamily)